MFLLAALAAVLVANELVAVPSEGSSPKQCTRTGSLSLLQATSQTSKTLQSEWPAQPTHAEGSRLSAAAWLKEAAERGHVMLQEVQAQVHRRLRTQGVLSLMTVPFILMAFCVLSVGIAALVHPERAQNSARSSSRGRIEQHVEDDTQTLRSLRLPADALTVSKSKDKQRTPTLLGRLFPDFQKSIQASPGKYGQAEFCPDLVVPKGCECVLLVPLTPLCMGPFDVCDPNGEVVLCVLPKSKSSPTSSPGTPGLTASKAAERRVSFGPMTLGPSWRLELTTGKGVLLAQTSCTCTSTGSGGGDSAQSYELLTADGGYYATLRGNSEGFELDAAGTTIHFWGSFDHHAVNITDAAGKLLATTELCVADFDSTGEYYRLRVAPLVDVGLLLCSLICIDQAGALSRRT